MASSISIGVLGAGTCGLALARMLCLEGQSVQVWSALSEEIFELRKTRRHKIFVEYGYSFCH